MLSHFKNYCLLALILFTPFFACTQNKHGHPKCEDRAFERMLENLLQFSVPLISCEELHKKSSAYLLLDTRERDEYDVSHIPGAKYAGYDSFDWNVLKNVPKNTPIVVYCSVGYRSEKIGEKIIAAGYSNVKNLYGSIFEWANRGYPLQNDARKTVSVLHTYNKEWGKWIRKNAVQKVN